MLKRRIQTAVFLLFAGLLHGLPALAADPASLKPQGYVSDFAGVVDAQSRTVLEQYCAAVEQATGAQFALVTIDTLDGAPIEDFTNSLYRKWGVGAKGKNEGALLLLVVKDHKSRIEVGYGLEPVLTDGFTGSILRDMRPALRQSQYGQALAGAAQALGEKIAAAKGVTIQFTPPRARRAPSSGGSGFPIGIIVFLFILFLLLRRGGGGGAGGFLAGMFLGNVLGRGGSGWGGGGFGGGDSGGGGFGGFGGGDSGGGGASSNW